MYAVLLSGNSRSDFFLGQNAICNVLHMDIKMSFLAIKKSVFGYPIFEYKKNGFHDIQKSFFWNLDRLDISLYINCKCISC